MPNSQAIEDLGFEKASILMLTLTRYQIRFYALLNPTQTQNPDPTHGYGNVSHDDSWFIIIVVAVIFVKWTLLKFLLFEGWTFKNVFVEEI